jgi:hypothetical protein
MRGICALMAGFTFNSVDGGVYADRQTLRVAEFESRGQALSPPVVRDVLAKAHQAIENIQVSLLYRYKDRDLVHAYFGLREAFQIPVTAKLIQQFTDGVRGLRTGQAAPGDVREALGALRQLAARADASWHQDLFDADLPTDFSPQMARVAGELLQGALRDYQTSAKGWNQVWDLGLKARRVSVVLDLEPHFHQFEAAFPRNATKAPAHDDLRRAVRQLSEKALSQHWEEIPSVGRSTEAEMSDEATLRLRDQAYEALELFRASPGDYSERKRLSEALQNALNMPYADPSRVREGIAEFRDGMQGRPTPFELYVAIKALIRTLNDRPHQWASDEVFGAEPARRSPAAARVKRKIEQATHRYEKSPMGPKDNYDLYLSLLGADRELVGGVREEQRR